MQRRDAIRTVDNFKKLLDIGSNFKKESSPNHNAVLGGYKPKTQLRPIDANNQGSKMFAVFKTGGKQYKVSQDDVILVEKFPAQVGDLVQFSHIMMVGADKFDVGTPTVAGAAVNAEVVEQAKSKKVISFIKRRRKHSSQRTRGHRQHVTVVRVKEILSSGVKVSTDQVVAGVSVIGSNITTGKETTVKTKTVKKVAVQPKKSNETSVNISPIIANGANVMIGVKELGKICLNIIFQFDCPIDTAAET